MTTEYDRVDANGFTPLMHAALNCDVQKVESLVKHPEAVRKINKNNGWTALMIASAKNFVEIVKLLVDSEGGIKNNDENTALMIAVRNGNYKCVEVLAKKEAKMLNKNGKTALMLAAINGTINCVKALIPYESGMKKPDNGVTALYFAAMYNRVACVQELLPHEKSILGKSNFNPLYVAAESNSYESLMLLIPYFKRITIQPNGWTALMIAVYKDNEQCVRELVKHEAKMSTPTGTTALMIAAQNNKLNYISILALAGDAGMVDNKGRTALMRVVCQEEIKPHIIQALIPYESKIKNLKDKDNTALHLAIKNKRYQAAELLVKEEALIRDNAGNLPIFYIKSDAPEGLKQALKAATKKEPVSTSAPTLDKGANTDGDKQDEKEILCTCGEKYLQGKEKEHFSTSENHVLVKCQFCKKKFEKYENHPYNGECPKTKICQLCSKPIITSSEHTKNIKCEICSQTIKTCQLEQHRDGHKIIKCKCGTDYEIKDEAQHKLTIPHRKVVCECGAEMEDYEYEQHKASNHGKFMGDNGPLYVPPQSNEVQQNSGTNIITAFEYQ